MDLERTHDFYHTHETFRTGVYLFKETEEAFFGISTNALGSLTAWLCSHTTRIVALGGAETTLKHFRKMDFEWLKSAP